MSFQTPITIAEAIENISTSRYLLPAIQREFEWPAHKIEWLFDSLMRGYPVSSFLFWNVEGDTVSGYKFYQFLRTYRERYNIHNEDANVEGLDNFTAVLDGQQRLTSMYIGLKGSYAYKEKRRHWNNDEWSIPTRQLYLNISEKLNDQEEEDGRVYEFKFLKSSETKEVDLYKNKWFRVGKILDLRNLSSFNRYIREKELDDLSADILARLQEVIFSDRVINYFLEKEQDLHKALNIFIRINSGGQPLNFSDLIMSIAVANWKQKDARQEIHSLVDSVREGGFSISKDFILKTYLYLYSNDIRFKVTNFTAENAKNFEENWEGIRDAVKNTFKLIRSFGYTDFTLTSKNVIIPIIYYLYHKGIHSDIRTKVQFKEERARIQKWLHVMTLKRVFGSQSDGTLSQIRKAFSDDVSLGEKLKRHITQFPSKEINNSIKRDLSVGDDFLDGLLKTQKDDRYAFSILALLYPNLDYRNNDFHKDHLHPISRFTKDIIQQIRTPETEDEREFSCSSVWYNSIVNLQLLDSNENMSKNDKDLSEWILSSTNDLNREQFLSKCLIPLNVNLDLMNFKKFALTRQEALRNQLRELLGDV